MLGLRRVGEATLLRDSDKIPQLINLHRHSDTPLGLPICLRLADRMGAKRAIQRQSHQRPIPKQLCLGKTAVGLETGLQPDYSRHFALGAAYVFFVIRSFALPAWLGVLRGEQLLTWLFVRLGTQMKSRTPRPGSRGLSTPVILSQTELTAGRTVSHGKAEVGFASS